MSRGLPERVTQVCEPCFSDQLFRLMGFPEREILSDANQRGTIEGREAPKDEQEPRTRGKTQGSNGSLRAATFAADSGLAQRKKTLKSDHPWMANGKKGENFGRKPGKRLLWRKSFEGSDAVVVFVVVFVTYALVSFQK